MNESPPRVKKYALDEPPSKLGTLIDLLNSRSLTLEEFKEATKERYNSNSFDLFYRVSQGPCQHKGVIEAIIETKHVNINILKYILQEYKSVEIETIAFGSQTMLQKVMSHWNISASDRKVLAKVILDTRPTPFAINLVTQSDSCTPLTLLWEMYKDNFFLRETEDIVDLATFMINKGGKFSRVHNIHPDLAFNTDLWNRKYLPSLHNQLGDFVTDTNVRKMITSYVVEWEISVCFDSEITKSQSNYRPPKKKSKFKRMNSDPGTERNHFLTFLRKIREYQIFTAKKIKFRSKPQF